MKAIVLRIDKKKGEVLLFDGNTKFIKTLPCSVIKRIIEWDVVELEDEQIRVLKRARPISVDKCVKLMNKADKPLIISIYGTLNKGFLTGEQGKLKILNPPLNLNLEGKEVLLFNVLLKAGMLELTNSTRIFSR